MSERHPLPVPFSDMPFSRRRARADSVADSRLRCADLTTPFHGVRLPAATPQSLEWRAAAYLEWRARPLAFSHLTAARLLRLPLPNYVGDSGELHVSVPSGSRPPESRGILGHELDAELWMPQPVLFRSEADGRMFELPVVPAAVTWVQLAGVLDLDDLIAVGDAIVSGEHPLATVHELEAARVRWGRRRGARALAAAQPQVRMGVRSRPESLQRLMMVRAGLPEPELNVTVFDGSGNALWDPDHSWERFRVLNEYDGRGHASPSKVRSDIDRHTDYAEAGWAAVRSHSGHVFDDPNPKLRQLWKQLVARGWCPATREPRRIAPARR